VQGWLSQYARTLLAVALRPTVGSVRVTVRIRVRVSVSVSVSVMVRVQASVKS